MLTALGILIWTICGVVDFGMTFGYFHREYPTTAEEEYWRNFTFSCFAFLAGPIGLFVSMMMGFDKHGFKWR